MFCSTQKRSAACITAALAGILVGMVLVCGTALPVQAAEQKTAGRIRDMTDQTNTNIGTKFPTVSAESLAGNPENIPDSARGKVTLVTVAFLRENQAQLDSWLGPFSETFGSRADVTFYEVPMISSGYKFMRFIIDGGMRGGLPQSKHRHVVTMYGDVEHYIKALNIDPRMGHAFLLDKEGVIRWQGQGFSTPETRQTLLEMTEKLAQ